MPQGGPSSSSESTPNDSTGEGSSTMSTLRRTFSLIALAPREQSANPPQRSTQRQSTAGSDNDDDVPASRRLPGRVGTFRAPAPSQRAPPPSPTLLANFPLLQRRRSSSDSSVQSRRLSHSSRSSASEHREASLGKERKDVLLTMGDNGRSSHRAWVTSRQSKRYGL